MQLIHIKSYETRFSVLSSSIHILTPCYTHSNPIAQTNDLMAHALENGLIWGRFEKCSWATIKIQIKFNVIERNYKTLCVWHLLRKAWKEVGGSSSCAKSTRCRVGTCFDASASGLWCYCRPLWHLTLFLLGNNDVFPLPTVAFIVIQLKLAVFVNNTNILWRVGLDTTINFGWA